MWFSWTFGKLGCSKCLKRFSGSVGCMNYGGFDSLIGHVEAMKIIGGVSKRYNRVTPKLN